MNCGSQCQYHRSPRRRRLARKPFRSVGRGRCGLYSAIMSATSSSESNPSTIRSAMKSWIRAAPDGFISGTMSTSTTALAMPGASSPTRSIEVKPPRDAPTRTGFGGRPRSTSRTSSANVTDPVVAVTRPVGFTVPAEVDGDRLPATLRHGGRGAGPRAAGLAAAVQEHHGARVRIPQPVRHDANATAPVGHERLRRCRHSRIVGPADIGPCHHRTAMPADRGAADAQAAKRTPPICCTADFVVSKSGSAEAADLHQRQNIRKVKYRNGFIRDL